MKLTRRRVLAISAAGLVAGPARPEGVVHRSFQALGADCTLTLPGSATTADMALRAVRAEVAKIERAFSLWDPASELSRLNRYGVLDRPSAVFRTLATKAAQISSWTGGAFDVTVQARWLALADGQKVQNAPTAWRGLEVTPAKARFLRSEMAATFNGIAQGFAADRTVRVLLALGYRDVLVNLGEFASIGEHPVGRAWHVGVADPRTGKIAADIALEAHAGAVATSEPHGTLIGGHPHIFDPLDRPGARWISVTVVAAEAAVADALSTAVAASPTTETEGLLRGSGATHAILISADGAVTNWAD